MWIIERGREKKTHAQESGNLKQTEKQTNKIATLKREKKTSLFFLLLLLLTTERLLQCSVLFELFLERKKVTRTEKEEK